MIDFALKLTEAPAALRRADMEQLLAAGFSEEEALDIVLITASFAFMNRLADGLGVELDPMMKALVERNAGLGAAESPESSAPRSSRDP